MSVITGAPFATAQRSYPYATPVTAARKSPTQIPLNIDLIDFPTIFWAEIEYSIYALRQASRRSWRIGQARPVEVYFAVYDGTLQAEALSLVGRKLRAALLVEGELPQEGLATQDLDDGDLMLTLAKRLAAGERADTQALEALFAESRALETVAGDSLDGAARAGCNDPDWDGNLQIPPTSATAPSAAPKQQLALPILLLPPPRSDETTARGEENPAWTPTPIQHRITPTVPASEGAFIPSAGKVVPLTGWLGLTAPPAPPRRRKQPARDQLKLFG